MTSWIHFANALYLVSYLVQDILWLRVLTVVAALSLIPYYATNWLGEAIAWNVVFLVINIVQIKLLLLKRLPVKLDEKEQSLYSRSFRALSPREFLHLLDAGSWKTAKQGDCLITQETKLDSLMVIHSGKVDVQVDGTVVASLGAGQFVGEMSFVTGEQASASVVVADDLEYVAWPRDELEMRMKKHPEIRAPLQLLLGADIAHKLKAGSVQ
jgi:hypothetical protein